MALSFFKERLYSFFRGKQLCLTSETARGGVRWNSIRELKTFSDPYDFPNQASTVHLSTPLTWNCCNNRLPGKMGIKETVVDAPETLEELDLHEGDRLEGRDGKIVLVLRVEEARQKTSGVGFGTR